MMSGYARSPAARVRSGAHKAGWRRRGWLWLLLCISACSADPAGGGGGGGAAGSRAGSGGSVGSSGGAAIGGSGAGPDIDAIFEGECAKSSVASALLPANILFVLDRSGSMACNPPPVTDSVACEQNPARESTSAPSKWEITSAALHAAILGLPETTSIAISYFSNDDGCGVHPMPSVPFAPNTPAQRSTLAASLSGIEPSGGTPLVGATILAYQHMHQAALRGSIFGNEFVVLLTDGEQSEQCFDDARCSDAASCTELLVDEEVPRASAPGVGIKTFVIGAPGSEPARSVLSRIALAGGTAAPGCDPVAGNCHFDMSTAADFEAALPAALAEIVGRAITCELPVPVPENGEIDLGLVNVIYSPSGGAAPVLVRQDNTKPCDAGVSGWQYTRDETKIRLCGSICERVRGDFGGRVDVVLGCPVQGPD